MRTIRSIMPVAQHRSDETEGELEISEAGKLTISLSMNDVSFYLSLDEARMLCDLIIPIVDILEDRMEREG